MTGQADPNPFFIVGSSRSGTTLLRLVLAGHSKIVIPPETWFISPLVAQLPITGALAPAAVQSAIDIILQSARWPDMEMPDEEFRTRVLALTQPSLADIISIVYQYTLERAGKRRIGDKTPPYILLAPELKLLFPRAKFINLIRDGRDVAISFVDAGFEGRAYHGRDFEWTRAVRQRDAYQPTRLAEDFLDVRYETLIVEPEQTIRRICAFLAEEFEPDMLDFQSRRYLVPQRGLLSIHTNLDKPILKDRVGVWRSKLSLIECFLMEAPLHRDLRRLDYSLRFDRQIWTPLLDVTAAAMAATAPLLDRVLPALRRRGILTQYNYI